MTTGAASVFLADDDPVFNQIVQSVLNKHGIACESFFTSSALLARLAQKKPTLCMIDLNIESALSSLDTIKAIRKSISPNLPIIMVSSTTDTATIAHAIELGADDYLVKPLEKDVLIAKLMNYIKSKELENAAQFFVPAPKSDFAGVIKLDVSLLEIDPLGMKVSCKSLIPKGTVLSFSGEILHGITERDKPVLVTATSSWAEVNKNSFGIYLEFDQTDTELLHKIRNWIARKSA